MKKVPIPDDHPLAFVRDHARKFGTRSAWRTIEAAMIAAEGSDADIDGSDADTGDHAVPARVGLASATCLAANRDGLDPMIAVVYHPDIHGVCTLRELAQVTVVDLPAEARRAPLYWAVPAADAFLVGRAVTEWETLAEVGEDVVTAAPFEVLFAVHSQRGRAAATNGREASPADWCKGPW